MTRQRRMTAEYFLNAVRRNGWTVNERGVYVRGKLIRWIIIDAQLELRATMRECWEMQKRTRRKT